MPPKSTPAAAPPPATPPRAPGALFRSSPSGNVVETIESAAGVTTAAPRPCTARATISIADEADRPQTSDAEAQRAGAPQEGHAAPGWVGGAPAEQQEAAIRERVGRDHPLEVLGSEVQIRADR